jgi:hypothetical protein
MYFTQKSYCFDKVGNDFTAKTVVPETPVGANGRSPLQEFIPSISSADSD